jgi:stage IV sporulation protein FB
MFCSPQPTAYDLNFVLGRTRVSIHVGFWLMAAIFGWNWIRLGFEYVLIWVACVLLSILLHEFGHVWAGHVFGSDGDILLYSFGGLAIGSNNLSRRWQRVIVSLSGPAVQLLLYGFMVWARKYIVGEKIDDWPEHLFLGWMMMESINLTWPLLNLLPVWPLDGGMVMREFCEWLSPQAGTRVSLGISMIAAGFLAINTLLYVNRQSHVPYLHGFGMYTVLFFAMLVFESYQLLKLYRNPWDDDRQPWER